MNLFRAVHKPSWLCDVKSSHLSPCILVFILMNSERGATLASLYCPLVDTARACCMLLRGTGPNACTREEKIVLLDYADRNPQTNPVNLGSAVANPVNSSRCKNRVPHEASGATWHVIIVSSLIHVCNLVILCDFSD
jgi:hypothetical protein